MVDHFFQIKTTGATPGIMQRERNNVIRESYRDVGDQFVIDNLPKRFTYHGSLLLNFGARTEGTIRRKQKQFGHIDPNVESGESRDNALNRNKVIPRATRNNSGVRISFPAPNLNFRNPNSQAKPSEEVRRIAPQEAGPLNRTLDRSVQVNYDSITETNIEKV